MINNHGTKKNYIYIYIYIYIKVLHNKQLLNKCNLQLNYYVKCIGAENQNSGDCDHWNVGDDDCGD